jgi:hypothetical protein
VSPCRHKATPGYPITDSPTSLLGRNGPCSALVTRAAYFQQVVAGVTATAVYGTDPTAGPARNDRWSGTCFTAGDYLGIASNAQATVSTPFILQSSPKNDVLQSFLLESPLPRHPFPYRCKLNSLLRRRRLARSREAHPPSAYGRAPRLRRGNLDTKALGFDIP